MSTRWLVVGMILVGATSHLFAEPTPAITKEIALKAVTAFCAADPFSEDARTYAAILLRFTDEDQDVLIKISQKVVPFLKSKTLSQQEIAIVLGAFVAGNLDSQLLRGRKKDDAYAGELQVMETYRQMQKKKPKLRIPEIEKLIELESKGQLRSYLSKP